MLSLVEVSLLQNEKEVLEAISRGKDITLRSVISEAITYYIAEYGRQTAHFSEVRTRIPAHNESLAQLDLFVI